MSTNTDKKAADILRAIGNPFRFKIVNELLTGEKNVTALNKVVRVSQPALSQHLAKLRKQGLVTGRREQRQIFYSLKDARAIQLLATSREMAGRDA